MRLLLDMDGVLADIEQHFWDKWVSYVKDAPVIPIQDRRNFYIIDDLPEQYRGQAWSLMKEQGFFLSMPPIKGAIEGALALQAAGHDVCICTKPIRASLYCASEKQWWVRNWFGKEFLDNLVITSDKTRVRGDYLIDDAPEVKGSSVPEWRHVIFDTPYNRNVVGRPRVTGWDDVLARFV